MPQHLADLVIREVTSNVWTFSRPFARFGIIPFGGRSTAIKLTSGDVWVLASTPLTDDTKETIDKLGPVKWIMAGDFVHHLFLGEFKKAYPEAKVIGVEGLGAKKKAEGLILDGEYGKDPADTRYGFEDEVKACYFFGFINKDVAFCHVPSKSLIVADLFMNLPATEQYSKSKSSPKLPFIGSLNHESNLLRRMLWNIGKDKEAMRRDIKTVSDWDFERIIMCHGDVIEKDAKAAWNAAYSKYQT
ncbi:hypothetical protein VKT23_017606 [Stygiomarasmius scandens]|uniref:Uncharacterized protein n=1 Tax=Marasmiellus scandens TaxID=2682957 RepID=A0ABR1IRM8_9AGAR